MRAMYRVRRRFHAMEIPKDSGSGYAISAGQRYFEVGEIIEVTNRSTTDKGTTTSFRCGGNDYMVDELEFVACVSELTPS